MPKVVVAAKNYGPCDKCGLLIKKGQRYYRFHRHATAEEIADPKIKTISISAVGPGPRMPLKLHEDCKLNFKLDE